MQRHEAITRLKSQAEAARALGATAMYLFGSTARDDATEDSDLDLFIEYEVNSRFSLIDLVGIQQMLESRLGRIVDLTTRDSLNSLLKDAIEASALRIF